MDGTLVLNTDLKVWVREIRNVEGEREQQDERVLGSKKGKSFSQIQSFCGSHTATKFKFILLAM